MSRFPTAVLAVLGLVAAFGGTSSTFADDDQRFYERYVNRAPRPGRSDFANGSATGQPGDPWDSRPSNRIVQPPFPPGNPRMDARPGLLGPGNSLDVPPQLGPTVPTEDARGMLGFDPPPRGELERPYDGPNLYCDDCDAGFCDAGCGCDGCQNTWTWQFLPRGVLHRSYLAGPKESRLGVDWSYRDTDEWIMDGTIGGRFGFVRWGTTGRDAEGWQLGFETAALLRMNWTQELDVDGTDFRFGIPLEYSVGRWEWRLGYYHLSSHTGDEFLVRNATLTRANYIRDSINLGVAYFVTPDLRVYGEVSVAFHTDGGADPLHFQFGFDYSPIVCNCHGSPFIAMNVLLRQEVNYGGGVNVLAGWQWQNPRYDHLIRVGVRYYNGESTQYSFFDEHEELIGFGLWYDY